MPGKSSFNKLKSNKDREAILELLEKAHKLGSRILAWKDVHGERVTTDVYLRTIRKSKSEFEIYSHNPNSMEYEQVLHHGKLINLYFPELALLFQTTILEKKNEVSLLKFPEMIAQVERRRHLRLNLVGHPKCEVKCFFYKSMASKFLKTEVQTQYFEQSCHDVSAGGLSIVLPKQAAKFFSEGELVCQLYLSIGGQEMTVDGAIVAKVPIEPNKDNKLHYRGIKICLEFKNLDDESRKFIEDYVFKNIQLDEAV